MPTSAQISAMPNSARRAGDSREVNAMKNSRHRMKQPAVPGESAEDLGVDAAREVVVGLTRVAGEQPLEVVRCQVFGVGVPELTRTVAGWHLLHL